MTYRKCAEGVHDQPPSTLRDLLDFKVDSVVPVAIEEVESITAIRKRFVTPGMSLGALSPEAHGPLNIAMNRMGAKQDSGEGGEDPARFLPRHHDERERSTSKKAPHGRLSTTTANTQLCHTNAKKK